MPSPPIPASTSPNRAGVERAGRDRDSNSREASQDLLERRESDALAVERQRPCSGFAEFPGWLASTASAPAEVRGAGALEPAGPSEARLAALR
jgi:hypothetical protein